MRRDSSQPTPTGDPFFSVIISTYNRAGIVRRCVDSCLEQSFADFEVVVVDDASTDGTAEVLERMQTANPRLRVVLHEVNRGTHPARHTGVANSRGEWIVVVDSDDELVPDALERLHEIIANLPDGVRIVRSRLRWDDGSITPAVVPAGPIDYEGRIRWIQAEWTDAGQCMQRVVFDATPYFSDRRGAVEILYELDLAMNETSICVEDVLGKVHTDAPNSTLRQVSASELVPRLYLEAPDQLWMAETTLEKHGAAVERHGPRVYRGLLRTASIHAFLLGHKRRGAHHAVASLRNRWLDPKVLTIMILGLLGPRAIAYGIVAQRRLHRLRR